MCPSTDTSAATAGFAADVLQRLLGRINQTCMEDDAIFHVSHAWTDGPVMYLVYTAPPSSLTWGLVRDTRESIIDPGPWSSVVTAARYYHQLDLCENRVSASFRVPGLDIDVILWHGDHTYREEPRRDLPQRTSEIPPARRYTHPTQSSSEIDRDPASPIETRHYVDPTED
jgi:hypothetical protein